MTRSRLAALAALALAGGLAACGDDDSAPATAAGDYGERAAQICSDGAQEAVALPLPSSADEVVLDATAMAEIVANARDSLLALGVPEGQEAEAGVMLDEFAADVEQLEQIATTAASDGLEQAQPLINALDESAGQAALALDLTECAAFSNAVARTP